MADSFTQIYIQIVVAVKGRESLIHHKFEKEIYKYMSGTITGLGHKSIVVNGMPDHVHLLIGLNPCNAISDFVREFKKASSNFINEKGFLHGNFSWQKGYGAFSYSKSHLERIYQYIVNQKEHHKQSSFKSEYLKLLKAFEIDFKDEYIFEFQED